MVQKGFTICILIVGIGRIGIAFTGSRFTGNVASDFHTRLHIPARVRNTGHGNGNHGSGERSMNRYLHGTLRRGKRLIGKNMLSGLYQHLCGSTAVLF